MLTMSVAVLLYIIAGQYLVGHAAAVVPDLGLRSQPAVVARFLALPVAGRRRVRRSARDVRFYRTVFIEEMSRDYVRTARAKGCGDARVMVRHVLRNALIPILTNVVVQIPFLFTGALLLESFFGIPGLGALTVEAIQGNDFSTLRDHGLSRRAAVHPGPDPHRHQLRARRSPRAAGARSACSVLLASPTPSSCCCVAGGASWLRRCVVARDRFWRENARQLVAPPAGWRSPVIAVYVLIALLDSIAWIDPRQRGQRADLAASPGPSSIASSSPRPSRRRATRRPWRAWPSTAASRSPTPAAPASAPTSSAATWSIARSRARASRC